MIKPLNLKKNKKGQFGAMLLFFIVIAFVLAAGLAIGILVSSASMFMNEFVPEIESIGTLSGTGANVTEYSGYALTPLNTFISSWSWIGGVLYLVALIGLFGFAIGYKTTMNKWMMGLFIMFALLIIILSIIISNIYQDLYEDNSSFGDSIKSQKILSFLLLNSPFIMCIVVFASGIILFSGAGQEDMV